MSIKPDHSESTVCGRCGEPAEGQCEACGWPPVWADEDRDELAVQLAEAEIGPERYIGDLTANDWERIYAKVDAEAANVV